MTSLVSTFLIFFTLAFSLDCFAMWWRRILLKQSDVVWISWKIWLSVTDPSNMCSLRVMNISLTGILLKTAIAIAVSTPHSNGRLPSTALWIAWKHFSVSSHTFTTLSLGFIKAPLSFIFSRLTPCLWLVSFNAWIWLILYSETQYITQSYRHSF